MARTKQTARKSTGGKLLLREANHLGRYYRCKLSGLETPMEIDSSPEAEEQPRETSPVLNGDIREDLESALADSSINFNSEFAFSKSFKNAPNPTLQLANLGSVGLPLSPRDAETIKTRAVQAPFGMGERTLVDTTVRDTWELDANQVFFANPDWKEFVEKAALEVCQTLGVNHAASKPRFLPHVDTEKADGMFATMIIVLPSEFTGGAAHLSHRHLSRVYDSSVRSLFDTTVLAWYTDVMHEIKPITSGYRLALAYNVVHTTTSIRPALPTSTASIDTLTQVLEAWNEDTNGPEKLIYLLGHHKYSSANLSASALKGADAQKVAMMQVVAQKLGIGLGLANAHCTLSGCADDDGPRRYHRNKYYDSESDESDDENVGFAEVEEREMTIEHLVDLDGHLISEKLEYDEEHETIPADLAEEVEGGTCDGQEYEGYMGNGAGSLSRWYRRTVLVIWPRWSHFNMVYKGADGFDKACKDLPWLSDEQRQRDLANFLLLYAQKNPRLAAGVLCALGIKLDDLSLWKRAIETCAPGQGLAIVSHQAVLVAIERFGFAAVQSSLQLMLDADSQNATTLQFLNLLSRGFWHPFVTSVERVVEVYRDAQAWAIAKKDTALRNLKTPAVGECDILLAAVHERGEAGCAVLGEILLPQIQSLGTSGFLVLFARSVSSDKNLASDEGKNSIITGLLKAAISKISVLPPTSTQGDRHSLLRQAVSSVTEDRSGEVRMIAQACFDLENSDLLGDLVDRILESTSAAPNSAQDEAQKIADLEKNGALPGFMNQIPLLTKPPTRTLGTHVHDSIAQQCAQSIMLPLVAFLAKHTSSKPSDVPDSVFQRLQERAVALYLDWIAVRSSSFTQAEMATLVKATALHGTCELFMSTVIPRLKSMKLAPSAVRVIVQEMVVCKADFVFPENYAGPSLDSVIGDFAETYVKHLTPDKPANVTAALEWCLAVRQPALIPLVLQVVTRPALLNASYVNNVLVPSLPLLRAWGLNNQGLDSVAPGFQRIMAVWVDRVLGTPPALDSKFKEQMNTLKRWTCACIHCNSARVFLTSTAGSNIRLARIGAPNRKHVEGFLAFNARGLATYSTMQGSPQGLSIQKSAVLDRCTTWRADQTKGREILKRISQDEVEVKRLLGTEYDRVMVAVGAKPLPSTQAGSGAGAASSSTHDNTTTLQRPAPEATSAQQPPAKKRKVFAVNEADIIDLT